MRGNLVELAVAFVIGAAFATVVQRFTAVLVALLGKLGGNPNFDTYEPGGVPVGAFLTALVAFLIVAAVIYFFVVVPYNALQARMRAEGDHAPTSPTEDLVVLREIRDLLATRSDPTG